MKKLYEVVKHFDVEPFSAGEGDLFRFRLEVSLDNGTGSYRGTVLRLETYRLQPTFPQSKGEVPHWKEDGLVYVVDEKFAPGQLTGSSVEEVVQKLQQLLSTIFG